MPDVAKPADFAVSAAFSAKRDSVSMEKYSPAERLRTPSSGFAQLRIEVET
jgi:hypothetical protein